MCIEYITVGLTLNRFFVGIHILVGIIIYNKNMSCTFIFVYIHYKNIIILCAYDLVQLILVIFTVFQIYIGGFIQNLLVIGCSILRKSLHLFLF